MTRCVFVCELQEKKEDEKKKAGAQIKKRAKDATTKQEIEEEKTRGEEEAKEKEHLRLAKLEEVEITVSTVTKKLLCIRTKEYSIDTMRLRL